MIGDILQPTHLLFILIVALLVLGPKRLPEAGRALGTVIRDFRMAISGEDHNNGGMPGAMMSAPPPMAAPPVSPTSETTPAPLAPDFGTPPAATETSDTAEAPATDTSDAAEAAEPARPFV